MRAEFTKDLVVKDGAWVDARAYGSALNDTTIQAAITAISTDDRMILLTPGTWSITENLTIPANVGLKVMSGAVLDITNAKILTFQGQLEAGLYQIFSGLGTVVFGRDGGNNVVEVFPNWWGAVGDGTTDDSGAFQSALDSLSATQSGILTIPPLGWTGQCYYFTSGLTYTMPAHARYLMIRGAGMASYLFFEGAGIDGITIDGDVKKSSVTMKDISYGGAAATGDGLVLVEMNRSTFYNVICHGFGGSGMLLQGSILNTFIGGGVTVNLGSPGNKTQAVPTRGVLVEQTAGSGSNGNTFVGFNIEGITTAPGIGVEITGNSYGTTFMGGTIENNTIGVQVNTTTPFHQHFYNTDISVNGTDYSNLGGANSLMGLFGQASSGGANIIDADVNIGQNVNSKVISVGAAATGLITMKGTTGTEAGLATTGTPGALSFGLTPKGTGNLNLNSGLAEAGVVVSNAGGITFVTLGYGGTKLRKHLSATTTWDPGNLGDGVSETKDITVTGAAAGNTVVVGFSTMTNAAWQISGQVTAADTVTVTLTNHSGGALDLASGTLRADVWVH
jgi:hypothetical protein